MLALQFVCDWPECGQAFSQRPYLSEHIAASTRTRSSSVTGPIAASRSVERIPLTRTFALTRARGRTRATGLSVGKHSRHRRLHIGESKQFVCDWPGCGVGIARKDHLGSHRRTHTNDEKLVCTRLECGKMFCHKKNLKRHEKTHTK